MAVKVDLPAIDNDGDIVSFQITCDDHPQPVVFVAQVSFKAFEKADARAAGRRAPICRMSHLRHTYEYGLLYVRSDGECNHMPEECPWKGIPSSKQEKAVNVI